MRAMIVMALLLWLTPRMPAAEFVALKVQGDVTVREGVAESWAPVRAGDVLAPSSTVRTAVHASLLLAIPGAQGTRTIKLPPDVIVNCSDLRALSQEDLMLQLTMEKVRSSPAQGKNNGLNIPNVTVVHGDPGAAAGTLAENDPATGRLVLNGSKVLFDNGFYPTCALRTIAVMRQYPSLASEFDTRWLSAEALEKANLRREALEAYTSMAGVGDMTPQHQEKVRERIAALKSSTERN